ncbi:GerAB/ArcD/ProY family transporter [Bacillus sp. EB600]|uniref:GerAB/ArcD/ProY family transporter n=1 Tax=Bacillus sp. EB600 TaxID=2806345 RepID=UPI002108DA4B|nr:GerAB/ArcD/ProY family transporter [Bacillus sp. EB600]MCQ6279472.1 GerAB/ArcD/ProY family transporter [Bacillus sp. EB600]
MQGAVQERFQVSPFMAAYVIVSMQIGIGVLGFQRIIAKDAGYDAWISVISAGLTTNILVWMMYKICKAVDGDVMYANVYLFGKIIGNSINTVFIFYFILAGSAALSGLIEIIRTWMFLDFSPFWFAIVYLLLGIYIVFGGFRTVAGISFFGIIIPSYLVFSFGFALRYADFTNLLPIIDHTFIEMIKSGYNMSFSYLGFGTLLFFYPFIKKPEQSKKWVHIGLLSTTFFYTGLAVISFAYFPAGLLDRSIWPTLEMWKIVRLPIAERFEYLGIANWTIIILPNVAISLWVASRVAKRVYHVSQKKAVLFIALLCLIIVVQISTRERMNLLFNLDSKFGFTLGYVYTPILYLALLIKKKVKSK